MDLHAKEYNLLKQRFPQYIGREHEMLRVLRVLLRDMKNNVLFIGNPGIGKKTIAYGLASKLQANRLSVIDDYILLDTHEIMSHFTGNQETFLQSLKGQIASMHNTVFFMPDIHGLLHHEDEVKKLYTLFSTFVKRSDLHLIATIDPASYRQFVEQDHFLKNIFEAIRIEEVDEETAITIIRSIAKQKSVSLDAAHAELIVKLSRRYIASHFLPAKAIDILDECIAKIRLEQRQQIGIEDIKEVISDKTGIPLASISASDQERLMHLETRLSQKVIGQPAALKAVAEVIRRSRVGLQNPRRPVGSFLFLGGSGVGKTELAKSLADIVYDNENALIRLDMSEYTESHSLQRLIGAPPGYIGYEEGGQLTNPVWERPYSLLLLDEVEKANPKVFDIFLQVLDEGRLTDGQGKTVDFNNTIIIATSNAGYEAIIKDILEGVDITKRQYIDTNVIPILMKYFRIEFLNRFDEIVIFRPLDFDDLMQVARLQIQELQDRLADRHISLQVSDALITRIAATGKNPLFGARAIKRVIQQKLENTIAKKILQGEIQEGMTISW